MFDDLALIPNHTDPIKFHANSITKRVLGHFQFLRHFETVSSKTSFDVTDERIELSCQTAEFLSSS